MWILTVRHKNRNACKEEEQEQKINNRRRRSNRGPGGEGARAGDKWKKQGGAGGKVDRKGVKHSIQRLSVQKVGRNE